MIKISDIMKRLLPRKQYLILFKMTSWELQRNWDIVRYLVYYLIEDLVPPGLISGKDVIDFSAGLGDLSTYLYSHNPRSLTATSPDDFIPEVFADKAKIDFIPHVPANALLQKLLPNSADLFVARMVFQFPTDQRDAIDVDGILAQIHEILRPGGELIICSHEFTQLGDTAEEDWGLPLEDYLAALPDRYTGVQQEKTRGLIEMIKAIGLPPREGVHGQTGFGLKGIMAIDSFVQAGFKIKSAGEIEDFTFPVGISTDFNTRREYYQILAKKVFAIKQQYILSPQFENKYTRTSVLKTILREINQLHNFVSVPIFKIHAVK
jgi:SAM-dependent methyltransferase